MHASAAAASWVWSFAGAAATALARAKLRAVRLASVERRAAHKSANAPTV
jgi:hypothetical protein